jgi:hypothetical protein
MVLLLGTLKGMLSKALKIDVYFYSGSIIWETWSDAPFLCPSRKEKNFFTGETL